MNIPFDLKERLLIECLPVNVRKMPFEAELNALQALSEQLFTENERAMVPYRNITPYYTEYWNPDEIFSYIADPLLPLYTMFDHESSVGAIVGCVDGVCFNSEIYYNDTF